MRKLAMLLVTILSFSLGVNMGQGLITYVFEEEYKVAENKSDNLANTNDKVDDVTDEDTNDVIIIGTAQ